MNIKAISVLLFTFGLVSLYALGDEHLDKKDESILTKIQGSWKLVALEVDGDPAPPEIVAALKFVFENDNLTIIPGEPGWTNFKYTVDPTTRPPRFTMSHVDGTMKGETTKGIYSLDGTCLKICIGEAGEIPIEFSAKAGSGQGVYTLEREKVIAIRPEEGGDDGQAAEQLDGSDQPATVPEPKAERKEKPKSESEGRSQ